MRASFYFVFFGCLLLVGAHDLNLARFDIQREADQSYVFIRLDQENFLEAAGLSVDEWSPDRIDAYMLSHFAIEINGERVGFCYDSHKIDLEMVELKLQLFHSLKDVDKIGIYNDALMEIKEDQENIVTAFVNDTRRSFRMHKDRVRIQINY